MKPIILLALFAALSGCAGIPAECNVYKSDAATLAACIHGYQASIADDAMIYAVPNALYTP